MASNFNDTTPAAVGTGKNVKWQTDGSGNDSAYMPIMIASGGSHAPGLVPDTPGSGGSTKFLREDATWAVPAGGGGGASTADTWKFTARVTTAPGGNPTFSGDTFNHYAGGSSWNGYNDPTANYGPTTEDQNAGGVGTTYGFFGYAQWRTGRNISMMMDCAIPQTTNIRSLIGVTDTSNVSFCSNDDPSSLGFNYAAFRFSTNASDTVIQCLTGDGATQTVTSSGVTPDTNSHRFAIIFDDAAPNVKFYIDGNLVATNTTTLPSASKLLLWSHASRSLSGAGAHIFWSQVQLQQDL